MNTFDNIQTPTLASSAMLVNFSFNLWGDTRQDKSASQRAAFSNNADASAVKLTVSLMAGCKELADLKKFTSGARTRLRSMTSPWFDGNMRLLPTKQYHKFNDVANTIQTEWQDLVDAFVDVYQYEVMAVQAKLGDLFDSSKYPTVDQMRYEFGFDLKYMPVPLNNFFSDLEAEHNEILKAQFESTVQDVLNNATADIWNRLYPLLERMSTQLTDKDGKKRRIYDSLVGNVEEMIEFMQACNITNDPEIERVQSQLAIALRGVTPDKLRNSESMRVATKEAVDAVIKTLPSLDF